MSAIEADRRCIFCLTVKPCEAFNAEHVFAEAIGGTFIIWSVCVACNSTLGHTIDGPFVNLWFIQAKRALLGLSGKTGTIPNPFAKGVLAGDPRQEIHTAIGPDGVVEPHLVRNIGTVRLDDGSERIRMVFDGAEREQIPDVINTMLRRRGRTPIEAADIMEKLKTQATPVEIEVAAPVDLDVVARGLLKIAYEVAAEWLGDAYLEDPAAHQIRACLLETGKKVASFQLRGSVNLGAAAWGNDETSHIAMMVNTPTSIVVHVRVFNVFEGSFEVSRSAQRYPTVEQRFLALDPQTGKLRTSSLDAEIFRMGSAH